MSQWDEINTYKPCSGAARLKFGTREELQECIDDYFTTCDNNEKPYTVPGLALHIGVITDTLLKYGARDQFSDIVKMAICRCEVYAAESSFDNKKVQGAKLNLGVYMGRIEKMAHELNYDQTNMLDKLLERKAQLDANLIKIGPNLTSQPAEILDGELVNTEGEEIKEAD